MTEVSKERRRVSFHWLVLAGLMTIPLAAVAADRMVIGEYFTADW
jgi:hypothetical protein